jgi:peptide deformylase
MKFEIIPNEQTPKINQIIENIDEYMETHHISLSHFLFFAKQQTNAVGLAANQVSLDGERFMHRVFALRNLNDGSWRLIIDPKITEYIGMIEPKLEGCLTWKEKLIVAERYRGVRVSYYDSEKEDYIRNELHKGFEGQIWQHEINHLNGIEERVEEPNFLLPLQPKYERNDKCPCGSGKKYKQCCLLLI